MRVIEANRSLLGSSLSLDNNSSQMIRVSAILDHRGQQRERGLVNITPQQLGQFEQSVHRPLRILHILRRVRIVYAIQIIHSLLLLPSLPS